MKKPTLCVIFGGKSSEYEVSLRSAYGVITHIDNEKYELVRLGITRRGEWYIFEGENEEILKDEWHFGAIVPVTFDLSNGHLIVLDKELYAIVVDLFLPILHGEYGEDGRIQALFDIAGVKYVGCGAFSSHICMDKNLAKGVAEKIGVPVAKQCLVNAKYNVQNAKSTTLSSCLRHIPLLAQRRLEDENFVEIGYPVFVKPTLCGSSVGVSRVENQEELKPALENALKYGDEVLIEELVDGIEVEIGVLETKNGIVLSDVGMVKHKGIFYDYDTKYKCEDNEYLIPAPIENDVTEKIKKAAEGLFFALGCRGLARLDFFVKKDGAIVFNEVNTLPGFTEKSMFPSLFKGQGLDYGDVVKTMIENVIC